MFMFQIYILLLEIKPQMLSKILEKMQKNNRIVKE